MNKQFSSNFKIGGKIATMYLERGLTYNQFQILLDPANGLTKALIREVRVVLEEKTIWQIDPRRLNKIDAYKAGGVNKTDPAIINIDFTEKDSKNALSEFAGIIGTAPLSAFGANVNTLFPNNLGIPEIKDFRIEVEAVDATVPLNFLRLQYWVSSPSPLSRRIATLLQKQINLPSSGTHDLDLQFGPSAPHDYRRIWLFEDKVEGATPGVFDVDPMKITKVVCRKSGVDFLETERFTNEYDQNRYDGVPDDEFYCVDFGMANYNVQELLLTGDATNCKLKITTTGATNVTVFTEAYTDLSKL